jgi:hypothetical protein
MLMLRRFARMLMPVMPLVSLALTWAGGFFLVVHQRDAVLTVEAQGCHDYSHAKITGQAIGLVNGRRETRSLDLKPAANPGTFTVQKQWPAEGKWVLVFTGTYGDLHTYTLTEQAADGQWHPHMTTHPVSTEEIEAALR